MLGAVVNLYRAHGLCNTVHEIFQRLLALKASSYAVCDKTLRGGLALEIGGPSQIFKKRGLLPVYPLLRQVDHCNFAAKTLWQDGKNNHRLIIAEASDLKEISSSTYDLVLASHVLEHIANPIKALGEWQRILNSDGFMLLVLPHREGTFDHRRPVTSLAHMKDDFLKNRTEDDLTHLQEILESHDLSRDPGAGSAASFKERSLNNLVHRGLHHHVFNTQRVAELLDAVGFQILALEALRPCHIVVLAQKKREGDAADNHVFFSPSALWRKKSPFSSDRHSQMAS